MPAIAHRVWILALLGAFLSLLLPLPLPHNGRAVAIEPIGSIERVVPDGAVARSATPLDPGPAGCDCLTSDPFDWKSVPRVRVFPRPGNFPVLPTGPGYYALVDIYRGEYLQAPPKYPYPRFGLIQPSFFDTNNFSYLDDPQNTEFDHFDPLKRIRLGDNWLFVTGGDVRTRYENQYNARLGEVKNELNLARVRAYGDWWLRDEFRFYSEFIGAYSSPQALPPLPVDRNNADLLNLFLDLKIASGGGDPAYLRFGRQELLFGSQRLVSPLEWSTTRRTFQGVRGFRSSKEWDVDLFWVQPVVPNVSQFDSVDNNVNFAGAWATFRPKPDRSIDAYYLLLDDTNRTELLGLPRGGFTRHTFGGRYLATIDRWLFDFEAAMQLGSQQGRDVLAGMATAGTGYHFPSIFGNPTVWAYYDYASGGNPINGTAHTFNQLYPFGHYYLGWADQVGRQNIHHLNFHLYLYPTKWITTWLQYHAFWLADRQDALYNIAGLPSRIDPTGRAGSHVGDELNLVLNFHLSRHCDLLTGYSHLWGGEFLKNTASPEHAVNTSYFFVQGSYRW